MQIIRKRHPNIYARALRVSLHAWMPEASEKTMLINANQCKSMPLPAHLCESMQIHANRRRSMQIDADQPKSMLISAYTCNPMQMKANHCKSYAASVSILAQKYCCFRVSLFVRIFVRRDAHSFQDTTYCRTHFGSIWIRGVYSGGLDVRRAEL